MASISNTPSVGRCKSFLKQSSLGLVAQGERVARGYGARARSRCPSKHLTVDQYVGLIACIENEGGVATLDDIAHALPTVQRPISAVFDLCDAGILAADLEASLDGNMRVWRIDD